MFVKCGIGLCQHSGHKFKDTLLLKTKKNGQLRFVEIKHGQSHDIMNIHGWSLVF